MNKQDLSLRLFYVLYLILASLNWNFPSEKLLSFMHSQDLLITTLRELFITISYLEIYKYVLLIKKNYILCTFELNALKDNYIIAK